MRSKTGARTLDLDVRHVWNGGWAGRDQAAIREHVAELARLGVPAPTVTPIWFPLSNNLATTADRIQVLGGETSGEVEYALLVSDGAVYVTVASDHTDRGFEKHGVQASKQLYPNVLAPEAWPLEECLDHWDQLRLSCWVTVGGERRVYQQADLGSVLSAQEWLEVLRRERVFADGLLFMSGTPPAIGGLSVGDSYEIELSDPLLGRVLSHGYSVEVLGAGHQ
ncbi:MAG TPA: DUF2848 domain-containing protein [Candidatus Saccharimonadales bacterium]|nr:DUF2848 domain-containing protein [Candidatus Saccharimonadales bacterium]